MFDMGKWSPPVSLGRAKRDHAGQRDIRSKLGPFGKETALFLLTKVLFPFKSMVKKYI